MKFTMAKPTEIEFDSIRVVAEMRYPDEDAPDGMFGLDGETLDITIEVSDDGKTARIKGWTGPAIGLHTKVCDCCSTYLMCRGFHVVEREDDYVPGFMPGDHYGDYLILDIDADGVITNWEPIDARKITDWYQNKEQTGT